MILKTIHGGKKPTQGQLGLDLYANEDITIRAGETKEVRLGVCVDHKKLRNIILDYYGIPVTNGNIEDFMNSHHLELYPQDNVKAKGLTGSRSIINLKCTNELRIIVHYHLGLLEFYQGYTDQSKEPFIIRRGDRIAQILLKDHKSYLFWEE